MKTPAALAAALLTAALAHAGPGPAERAAGDAGDADPPAAPQAGRPTPSESRKKKVLQTVLYTDLTVNFQATPAREVFDFMRTALGINIEVRYADDQVAGIDPDVPITLEAADTPAFDVLDQVLEQCSTTDECTWQVRRGFLEVGTKDRLSVSAARETRWYRVDELTFEAPDFNNAISMRLEDSYLANGAWGFLNTPGGGGFGGSIQFQPMQVSGGSIEQRGESLVELIVTVIEPTAWTVNGGDRASIIYREGVLIVNAPDYIQRKLFGYPNVSRPPKAPVESGTTPAATQPQ